jgi:hypothetical protein
MTTKTISTYSSGFTFTPAYSGLIVTAAGTVGGTGVASGDLAAYTVANSGKIEGQGASLGVSLQDGGSVTNGGGGDATALIRGAIGVQIAGAGGTLRNFGAIEGVGAASIGIDLEAGGSIVNGFANDHAALIDGNIGIKAAGAATITNFGIIEGAGGTALEFTSDAGDLIIAPGASFIGKVLGDGGDLTLAAHGDGTLSGLGTNFTGFSQIGVAAKADWTLTGANTIAASVTLTNAGTLINDGKLAIDGAFFGSSAGVLVLDQGSVTDGAADLGGGALILKGDGGTLTGLGSASGLNDFGTLKVEGGRWTLDGATTIASGSSLDADDFVFNGDISNAGRLVAGTETGIALTGSIVNTGHIINSFTKYYHTYDNNYFVSFQIGGTAIGGGTAITNLGLIESLGGRGATAISMADGGPVINGSVTDTSAKIETSANGVSIAGAPGTVTNFGTIETSAMQQGEQSRFGPDGGTGISLGDGGLVVNGSAGDKDALIKIGYGGSFGISVSGGNGTVQNFGTINAPVQSDYHPTYAIIMRDGGGVTNGSNTDTAATIYGRTNGVDIYGASGAVINYGTIKTWTGAESYYYTFDSGTDGKFVVNSGENAVDLKSGGQVINGSSDDTTALLYSRYGVSISGGLGTVSNFGTIKSTGTAYLNYAMTGISLYDGGSVTNGSKTAFIYGSTNGVVITGAPGTVVNAGTIETSAVIGMDKDFLSKAFIVAGDHAIDLDAGGLIVNGSESDATALLDSRYGVSVSGGAAAIRNFATIKSMDTTFYDKPMTAISLGDGGQVVNGSDADKQALVEGRTNGVVIAGAVGTVINSGTIETWSGTGTYTYSGKAGVTKTFVAAGNVAVDLGDGGEIENGDPVDAAALISGYFNGVYASSGVVRNDGTVIATASKPVDGNRPAAIHLETGGTIVNGDSAALIQGYLGVDVSAGAAVVTNFGAIAGAGAKSGVGVLLHDDGVIVNGSAVYRKASITGFTGASLGADATVTNFGTIQGTGGVALAFHGAGGRLVVEGGSAFDGKVIGDGATLELDDAGGAGTIAGIGVAASAGGFTGFADIRVASGAEWTLTGSNTIAANGTLVNDGALTATGTLTALGAIEGKGVIDIAGAASLMAEGAVAAGQTIGFSGGGTLVVGDAAGFGASVAGFGQGDGIDLASFGFSAAEKLHFSENAAKTEGALVVTDGSLRLAVTLFGQFMAAGFSVKTDGHSGSIVTYTPTATTAAFQLAAPHH